MQNRPQMHPNTKLYNFEEAEKIKVDFEEFNKAEHTNCWCRPMELVHLYLRSTYTLH